MAAIGNMFAGAVAYADDPTPTPFAMRTLYRRFPDKTFPVQSPCRTDVSRMGIDVSRTSYTKEFSCT